MHLVVGDSRRASNLDLSARRHFLLYGMRRRRRRATAASAPTALYDLNGQQFDVRPTSAATRSCRSPAPLPRWLGSSEQETRAGPIDCRADGRDRWARPPARSAAWCAPKRAIVEAIDQLPGIPATAAAASPAAPPRGLCRGRRRPRRRCAPAMAMTGAPARRHGSTWAPGAASPAALAPFDYRRRSPGRRRRARRRACRWPAPLLRSELSVDVP